MKLLRYPGDLRTTQFVLPSLESNIRAGFDVLMDQAGIRLIVSAQVDDMPMLRLTARETKGVTLVPPVVVKDELESGVLTERHRLSELKETFYAITLTDCHIRVLQASLQEGPAVSFWLDIAGSRRLLC
ncbi:MAG: hypothetical protein JNJ83_15255 [Verrucomicrobiaceae bacterium]|nr:hypothetical protein [Verrucomicrobiaceae bacterium]